MEKYNVKFKKKFGQNFLKDNRIVKRIVDICDIDNKSLVIEVGPGGGIMTRELALKAKNVLAYEIDTELEDEISMKLHGLGNVDVLFQDFLEADIVGDIIKPPRFREGGMRLQRAIVLTFGSSGGGGVLTSTQPMLG